MFYKLGLAWQEENVKYVWIKKERNLLYIIPYM